MEKRKIGAWIVDVQKHLQEYSGAELSLFDATIVAGKTARLLAKLRKMEVIEDLQKLEALAAPIGILPSELKKIIPPTMGKHGMVDVHLDGSGGIRKIEENVPEERKILDVTTEIWENEKPKDVEHATVKGLELCSLCPRTEIEFKQDLLTDFSQKAINLTLDLNMDFGLLSRREIGLPSPILYPEYIWGNNAPKIARYLAGLAEDQRNVVDKMLREISTLQAKPLEEITVSQDYLDASRKVGLIDVCQVNTKTGVKKQFVYTPRMWGTLAGNKLVNDIYDDVKLFLASIRFGERYSSTSRIRDPIVLVNALVERDTHRVGPATAIGTDYPLLEIQGIIKVEKAPSYRDRYYMTLVKEDVAKTALEILTHERRISLGGEPDKDASGLYQTGQFVNPEQDRIRLRKLGARSERILDNLIKTLRGEVL